MDSEVKVKRRGRGQAPDLTRDEPDGALTRGHGNLRCALGRHTGVSECERFLLGEHAALTRAAYLLTGDQSAAQDLVQETLVRVIVQWRRVARADQPAAYVHRMMLNAFLSGRRRSWHGELPHAILPDQATGSPYTAVDEQDVLRRALLTLSPRQRAAVVLRHYEDRSEADTAALMGCSVGTVKSLGSRGLAALRAALAAETTDSTSEGTAAR